MRPTATPPKKKKKAFIKGETEIGHSSYNVMPQAIGMIRTVDGHHSDKTLEAPVRSPGSSRRFTSRAVTADHQSERMALWDGDELDR